MDNNDLLRRLRYALRCDDAQTARLVQKGGGHITTRQVARWRAKEAEPEYEPCRTQDVEWFLAGLIIEHRGPREEKAPSPWPDRSKNKQSGAKENAERKKVLNDDSVKSGTEPKKLAQIDNNVVLKQLRIALSLRSDDVHSILQAGGSALSASEAGALFRKPDARNYRKCGDQVLRQFITGLVKRREQQSGNT